MLEPIALSESASLGEFVQRAWDEHAQHPQAVADELRRRAPAVTGDEPGADAIGLAEHVLLAHLHDPGALQAWLQALPPAVHDAPACAAALLRARVALAALRGEPAPPAPEAVRWRALHAVWAVWAHEGQAERALTQLRAEEPRALQHHDAAATRALAATCNNCATDLCEGPRGDAARDALMLEAAHAARRLWTQGGTWVHAERAEYRLARCHAVLGLGEAALGHARACLAALQAHAGDPQADALESFFAHEALAWAARAAGDAAGEAAAVGQMAALLPQVPDAALRDWAAQSLQALRAAA
jgi:hypothetical protein